MVADLSDQDLIRAFEGALVLNKPFTLTQLRKLVESMAYRGISGLRPRLTVVQLDSGEWAVATLIVVAEDAPDSMLLLAVPEKGSYTPFIIRRGGARRFRTLETLIKQFTEIFGERTPLQVTFNTGDVDDLENGD